MRGAGEPSSWGEPTQSGGAGSFSASPSANPVGRRRSCGLRAHTDLGVGGVLATAIALLLVTVLASTALVYGKASHAAWPTNNCRWRHHPYGAGCGVYRSHNRDQDGVMRGTGRSDELLGGHGNDTI